MDNEGLSNEWRENPPMDQEIDPWLYGRLEERARPLNSRVLTVDKPALISTGYQKLLRLSGKSNRIADSVLGRVRLPSGIFQADKLSLFSRTFSGIISRDVTNGTSNLYKMLNLPWFRPKRGYKIEPVNDSGLVVRQEMSGDSTDDLNDTVILPDTEPVEDNLPEKHGKAPETYIDYMISSPITRRTIMNINNQDRDSVPRKSSILITGKIAETHNLIGTEKNNRGLSGISRGINRPVTDKEVIQDRFGIQQDGRTPKITGYSLHPKEDRDTGQATTTGKDAKRVETIDYPSLRSEDGDVRQITAIDKGTERVQTLDHASPRSEEKNTGRVTAIDQGTERVETINYPSPHREERNKRQISTNGTEATKRDISSKSEDNKGNSAYPVTNLFYKKSLPIVRKIIRSLPFVRNIQRKEIFPSESVIQPADQRQTGQSDNYGHLDNPEIVYNDNESPGVTPVNADFPALQYINKTATKDSNIIDREFQDTGYESQTDEPQKLNKSAISRETGIKVDARLAYPVKDLFYRKPLPLTGRLVQSLPLVKNIQRNPVLASEPAKRSIDRRPIEQSYNLRSPENLETVDLHEVNDKSYEPAQESPLISDAITPTKSESRQNGIFPGDSPTTVPDFIMPVDSSLDLTLAPVSRMSTVQRREEYPRTERSPAEPRIARSTQKFRPATTQQTETSEETATGTQESSISSNDNMLDYRTIARETYPFIRRMIMVERERRPSR